ncbi:hypothetical protein HYX19_04810 [Candidatus Woesearchaeota archaeon]|nr:hypothetical protein [Candidatus Woesearchaeota archaeon]
MKKLIELLKLDPVSRCLRLKARIERESRFLKANAHYELANAKDLSSALACYEAFIGANRKRREFVESLHEEIDRLKGEHRGEYPALAEIQH